MCIRDRASAPFTVALPVKKEKKDKEQKNKGKDGKDADTKDSEKEEKAPTSREFPAGSYIIRMDQPYSRIADALLDHQYWSPEDPQKTPYDDTGWTFGELFGVQVARVTDVKVLDAAMKIVSEPVHAAGGAKGDGIIFAINNNAEPAMATLRYRLKDASIEAAEEGFESDGKKFNRGTFLIRNVGRADVDRATAELGLQAIAMGAAPGVKTHPVRAARVAFVHTWLSTQMEGWWRLALDDLKIPYDYISTQTVAKTEDLNAKYDVILFPPIGYSPGIATIVDGLPLALSLIHI